MSKMLCITEEGAFMASEPMDVESFINMTLSTQLNLFNHTVLNAPEEDQAQAKEDLYDLYNRAASAFLAAFAPEIEMRPDLTVDAIMRAENEILDEMPPKEAFDMLREDLRLAEADRKE